MSTIFGIPTPALYGQILIGLINGSFYALLSLGLAVIFGLLRVINFAHGAQYMLGAFAAYLLLEYTGIGYWPALIVAPLIVGASAVDYRAHDVAPSLRTRSPLRPAVDVRPRAHFRGRFPILVRRRGQALFAAPATLRRRQSRLHVPAHLSRVGRHRVPRHLPRHMASHRKDAGLEHIFARRPRTPRWCRLSASTFPSS